MAGMYYDKYTRSHTRNYTPPPSPKYQRISDTTLEEVDPVVQVKKQSLIDQLEIAKTAYKQETDKNTGWMLLSAITVIVPLMYYGIKGAIMESLPYNRGKQCERLIEVVKAIGTKEPLGKKFLREEFQNLFKLLKSGKSNKLMSLLVEVYRLNQETSGYAFSLDPINQHIRFFTKPKLTEHLPVSDIADLVLEYSKEASAVVKDENQATLS